MKTNRFLITYSHSRDLNNYVNQLRGNLKYQYGMNVLEMSKKYFPEKLLIDVINAPNNTIAEFIVLNYWHQNRKSEELNKIIKNAEELNTYINNSESKIIKPLEDLYQNKFPFEKINIYLTTFFRCPYWYPDWFMCYSEATPDKLIRVSLHELNHFMFYFYWRDKLTKVGITEKQLEYLKEAMAVLTKLNGAENKHKIEVLPIQNFIKENSDKPIDEIIELVIKNKLLINIK